MDDFNNSFKLFSVKITLKCEIFITFFFPFWISHGKINFEYLDSVIEIDEKLNMFIIPQRGGEIEYKIISTKNEEYLLNFRLEFQNNIETFEIKHFMNYPHLVVKNGNICRVLVTDVNINNNLTLKDGIIDEYTISYNPIVDTYFVDVFD